MSGIRVSCDGPTTVVAIDRPRVRNAVDPATAADLAAAFRAFDADGSQSVAVLTGSGGTFCSGFDLNAVAGMPDSAVPLDGDAPMGVSRLVMSKPVIAAVEGHAVAGGLELALWCDVRIASTTAVFGVFCRRFGVPLVDGGTVRLPRIVGHGRAIEMILTGRAVDAEEALRWGLVNSVVPAGTAFDAAMNLAGQLATLPQRCMRSDRLSAIEQWSLPFEDAMRNETRRGIEVMESGEPRAGAQQFREGAGRHGERLGG